MNPPFLITKLPDSESGPSLLLLCEQCHGHVDAAVMVGDKYTGTSLSLCQPCLQRALDLFPKPQTENINP
jgi:hypothetical protein